MPSDIVFPPIPETVVTEPLPVEDFGAGVGDLGGEAAPDEARPKVVARPKKRARVAAIPSQTKERSSLLGAWDDLIVH